MSTRDHTHKMTRGWLLPYLLALDVLDAPEHGFRGHGRWRYWLEACERGSVPEGDNSDLPSSVVIWEKIRYNNHSEIPSYLQRDNIDLSQKNVVKSLRIEYPFY